jgi:hypothetical protein
MSSSACPCAAPPDCRTSSSVTTKAKAADQPSAAFPGCKVFEMKSFVASPDFHFFRTTSSCHNKCKTASFGVAFWPPCLFEGNAYSVRILPADARQGRADRP